MVQKNKQRERILMLVLLFIVLAALLVYLILGAQKGDSYQVVIEVSGTVLRTLPLSEDTTYRIELDGGYNLLVIENGAAYVAESDCPGGDCIRHGKISPDSPLNLRIISCLPRSLTIYLKEGSK